MPYCKALRQGRRPADVGKGFEFGYVFLLKREEACSPPVSCRSLKEATLSFVLEPHCGAREMLTWQLQMRT